MNTIEDEYGPKKSRGRTYFADRVPLVRVLPSKENVTRHVLWYRRSKGIGIRFHSLLK